MKIAVSGKGGVGKTSLSALLCRSFQSAGYRVLAIDADPDANLASTLGFPEPDTIVPIVDMKDLITERTGVQPGTSGGFFKLNPRVEDVPERFGLTHDGIRLMVMGRIKEAGTGCYCPESAFVKELIGHLLLNENDVVVMDMEAGIEHLGRGTSRDVDAFVIVVEPGKRSIETGLNVMKMAAELGIKKCFVVANKVRNENDRSFIGRFFSAEILIGMLPYSPQVLESGQGDTGIHIAESELIHEVRDRLLKGATHG